MSVTVPVAPVAAVAENDALELPAGTNTDAGMLTPALLRLSVTPIPPGGATPFRFTLQDAVPGAVIEEEAQVRELNATGGAELPIVNCADFDTPLKVPLIVTVPVAPEPTVAENEAPDAPAGTTTQVGTVTSALLLLMRIPKPPVGAGPVMFMLHAAVPGEAAEEPQVAELSATTVTCAQESADKLIRAKKTSKKARIDDREGRLNSWVLARAEWTFGTRPLSDRIGSK